MAVDVSGALYTWGHGKHGALGHGDRYVHADTHMCVYVCVRAAPSGMVMGMCMQIYMCVCVCVCVRAAPSGMVIGICMQTFLFISISLLHYSVQ